MNTLAEKIFKNQAGTGMIQFEEKGFKKKFNHLYKVIIRSMEEYAKAYAPVPITSEEVKQKIEEECEVRYPVKNHSTPSNSPYVISQKTFRHGCNFGYSLAAPVPGKEEVDLDNDEWDNLIKTHIEKMWGGLEMASIDYFIQTGRVNGSFRLRLIALMKFYKWKVESKNSPSTASNEEFLTTQFPGKQELKNTDEEDLKHFLKIEPKAVQKAAKEWVLKNNNMTEADIIGVPEGKQYNAFLAGASFNSDAVEFKDWCDKNLYELEMREETHIPNKDAYEYFKQNSIQQAHDKSTYE